MDSDSSVLIVKTDDTIKDLKDHDDLFYLGNFNENHELSSIENKKNDRKIQNRDS